MKMHANESAGLVTIDQIPSAATLEVVNNDGQIIQSAHPVTTRFTIDIENWKDGLYFIKAIAGLQTEMIPLTIKH